jgi:hypothetical protein
MSAIPKFLDHNRQAEPLDVLTARAEARAYLVAIGALELADAVDVLDDYAMQSGLVARIGQDAVQAILHDAFAPLLNSGVQDA